MSVLALGVAQTSGVRAFDLVAETKRHLFGMQREQLNRLAVPTTFDARSLTFLYDLVGIQQGAYVQVGLELFYVWQVDVGSKTAIVEPAQLGTPTSEHEQGDVVTVNPKFADYAIFKALNDDIVSLSSPTNGLYAVRVVDLTGVGGRRGYDLAGIDGEVLDILSVQVRGYGSSRDWAPITGWEYARNLSATDFPSGSALFLHHGVPAGQPVRMTYKTAFTPMVELFDDVTAATGLPASALDIPPMGAVERLAPSREIKRNFTEAQGDSRRAEEVQAGAVGGSARPVSALRQRRVQEEASKLAQRYPIQQDIPVAHDSYGWGWGQWR